MRDTVPTLAIGGLILLATACESSEPPAAPANMNPEQLSALLQRCRVDAEKAGESLCRAGYEEFRKRFYAPAKPAEKRG